MLSGTLTHATFIIFAVTFLMSTFILIFFYLYLSPEHRRFLRRKERAGGRLPAAAYARQRNRAGPSLRLNDRGRFRRLERLVRRWLPDGEGIETRLRQAGARITLSGYLLLSVALGVVIFTLTHLILGFGVLIGLASAGGAALVVPRALFGWLAGRRKERFLAQLPEALDMMVRGLQSGLPISETIATIGRDYADPVGQEFRRIQERMRLGIPLADAIWESASSLGLQEFNFLAISISIQSETGGNLTEALRNLADILRRREQMKLKVRAISSEARASAYVLTGLPFLVCGVLFLLNPDYMIRLFTEPLGTIMLGIGLTSIGVGIAVMAKMVRFEI